MGKLDDGVGVMPGHAIMSEQRVQEGTLSSSQNYAVCVSLSTQNCLMEKHGYLNKQYFEQPYLFLLFQKSIPHVIKVAWEMSALKYDTALKAKQSNCLPTNTRFPID
jgi:hypothetical protein